MEGVIKPQHPVLSPSGGGEPGVPLLSWSSVGRGTPGGWVHIDPPSSAADSWYIPRPYVPNCCCVCCWGLINAICSLVSVRGWQEC